MLEEKSKGANDELKTSENDNIYYGY